MQTAARALRPARVRRLDMKSFWLAVLTAAPLAALAVGNSPDESFYKAAAEGGIAEVDLGHLADKNSTSPKVKEFAEMMVKDHSAANQKLQALAAGKGVSLPMSASAGDMATKAKLEALSGDSFDKSYIKSQVKAHVDTVKLLRKEIASGQDTDAKAFARSILPTVQAHLKAARAIEAEQTGKS
jgi:putative membrane protein